MEHFRLTRNTTIKVPLYEDAAVLVGIIIAATGIFLAQIPGNTVFDALASIGVGMVLLIAAFELGSDSRRSTQFYEDSSSRRYTALLPLLPLPAG